MSFNILSGRLEKIFAQYFMHIFVCVMCSLHVQAVKAF